MNKAEKITPENLKQKIKQMREPIKTKDNSEFLKSLSLVTSLGITMLAFILVGLFVGIYLDNKLGTRYIMPICIVLGIITGGWSAYKLLKPFIK